MGESQCPHCGHVVTGFEQQEFEIKHAAECEAANTIARLRADLCAALAVLQEFVDHTNGKPGNYGAIIEAAEQILASHKENADG